MKPGAIQACLGMLVFSAALGAVAGTAVSYRAHRRAGRAGLLLLLGILFGVGGGWLSFGIVDAAMPMNAPGVVAPIPVFHLGIPAIVSVGIGLAVPLLGASRGRGAGGGDKQDGPGFG